MGLGLGELESATTKGGAPQEAWEREKVGWVVWIGVGMMQESQKGALVIGKRTHMLKIGRGLGFRYRE